MNFYKLKKMMALENCHLAAIVEVILKIDLGMSHPWRLKAAHES